MANPRPTARRRHAARGLKAEIEPFPKLEVPVALGSDLAVPSAGHCLLGHKHEGFKSPAAARAQFQNAPRALEGLTATKKVKVQIQPKVTFSQGKAVKASLNWGKMQDRGTQDHQDGVVVCDGAGQRFRVLQCIVADDINALIPMRFMGSKEEWQGE